MKELNFARGWYVLQDVLDMGEKLGASQVNWDPVSGVTQGFSAWEPIDRLTHLQLLFAQNPNYGRELRQFNNAPWWYKREFMVPEDMRGKYAVLRFDGVDYYCKVWLNGHLLGEHEGYSSPFEFEVGDYLNRDGKNVLVVRVWSPWDKETLVVRDNGMDLGIFFNGLTVIRNMIKGTYEHTLACIQRDINPVGIWREVKLISYDGIRFHGKPCIRTTIQDKNALAEIDMNIPISAQAKDSAAVLRCRIIDEATGLQVESKEKQITLPAGLSEHSLSVSMKNPKLWNTWDRGNPCLYCAVIEIWSGKKCLESRRYKFGIREISIKRTDKEVAFILNGNKIFIRGTTYFPDVYISRMNRDHYLRDLKAIRNAGCNAIRIHIHVARPELYDICDELGLAIMQDSDLRWAIPTTEEFKDRAVKVVGDMIVNLRNHASIICWGVINEPDVWMIGVRKGMFANLERPVSLMDVIPGPQLVEAIKKLDPTRPYIKGSWYDDDPESGDSHNYYGSMDGAETHYTDIFDTTEKLNTEFGFDAPACIENLYKMPKPFKKFIKLENPAEYIKELQYYQYRLLKYFIEHYRIQKYNPCGGFFQFMFTDMLPQSFFGVYDWWGLPKEGLKAFEESSQPLGVFMEYKDKPVAIWVINDLLQAFNKCVLKWTVCDDDGNKVTEGSRTIDVGSDSAIRVCDFSLDLKAGRHYDVILQLDHSSGEVLTRNVYRDAFVHPPHPEGHPDRLDEELGMRLFGLKND